MSGHRIECVRKDGRKGLCIGHISVRITHIAKEEIIYIMGQIYSSNFVLR